jgi:hypothetical protein
MKLFFIWVTELWKRRKNEIYNMIGMINQRSRALLASLGQVRESFTYGSHKLLESNLTIDSSVVEAFLLPAVCALINMPGRRVYGVEQSMSPKVPRMERGRGG